MRWKRMSLEGAGDEVEKAGDEVEKDEPGRGWG